MQPSNGPRAWVLVKLLGVLGDKGDSGDQPHHEQQSVLSSTVLRGSALMLSVLIYDTEDFHMLPLLDLWL